MKTDIKNKLIKIKSSKENIFKIQIKIFRPRSKDTNRFSDQNFYIEEGNENTNQNIIDNYSHV